MNVELRPWLLAVVWSLLIIGMVGCMPAGTSGSVSRSSTGASEINGAPSGGTAEESCADDGDCPRGTICEASACLAISCRQAGRSSCPEAPSGATPRTCLRDEQRCSVEECGGALGECSDGKVCVEMGDFSNACAQPLDDDLSQPDEPATDSMAGMPTSTGADATGNDPSITTTGGVSASEGNADDLVCAACDTDLDCAELGSGARCTGIGSEGRFCTKACDVETAPCGPGFTCLAMVDQCVPVNFDCTKCPARACADGEVCNAESGLCTEPKNVCQACVGDIECADGLKCATLGAAKACLPMCDADAPCAAGSTCAGDVCTPDGGACDACDGTCIAPTPACRNVDATCVACVVDGDCPDGQRCDASTNRCVAEVDCVSDGDCVNVAGRPVCFQGACVECLQTDDCPGVAECSGAPEWTCRSTPCSGVNCQTGTACDVASGRCLKADGTPGCLVDTDCDPAGGLKCNPPTGQCYIAAFSPQNEPACDLDGSAVCATGSQCIPHPLFMVAYCTCRTDPTTMQSIGCWPGQICVPDPLTMEDDTDGGCVGGL